MRRISTLLAKNHSLCHRRSCSNIILRQGSMCKNNYKPHTQCEFPRITNTNRTSWRPFSSINSSLNSDIEHDNEYQQKQELHHENQNTSRQSRENNSHRTRKGHNFQGKKNKKSPTLGATTEWIKVTGIPPLSTLDELLVDIERIMKTELNTGIVDLDVAEGSLLNQMEQQEEEGSELKSTSESPFPLWYPNSNDNTDILPPNMVLEAHLDLSTLYRQSGWFLRLPNRSCVHALLSHVEEANRIRKKFNQDLRRAKTKKSRSRSHGLVKGERLDNDADSDEKFSWMNYETRPLTCCWKEVEVFPFHIKTQSFFNKFDWIDDTVIRVENCPPESTVADVQYFFDRYNVMDETRGISSDDNSECNSPKQAVQLVVTGNTDNEFSKMKSSKKNTPSMTNIFLVQFKSAGDARAAIRDRQNVELMGRKVKLAQFSSQLIPLR